MADEADQANELMDKILGAQLANATQQQAPAETPECEECGEEIPAKRREIAPWATRCIDCQEQEEMRRKHHAHR